MTAPDRQDDRDSLRLDLWLWHARVHTTRSACAELIAQRGVRINGRPTYKPSAPVRPGDVLTLVAGPRVRVLRVLELAQRRGPASAARLLFEEIVSES